MAKYETMLITSAALDEEASAALVGKFKSLIEANGTIDSIDEWGKRRLAYPINDEEEGVYTVINSMTTICQVRLPKLLNNPAKVCKICIQYLPNTGRQGIKIETPAAENCGKSLSVYSMLRGRAARGDEAIQRGGPRPLLPFTLPIV